MRIKQKMYNVCGVMAMIPAFLPCSTMIAYASDASGLSGRVISNSDGLTTLFYTYGFQGSMETISKLPWVGTVLSGIISIACLIGLFVTCFGIIMSMLYLSSRNLFDRVHEIKSAGKGQKFFGIQAMGSQVFNGNFGTGLDAIVGFFLALLPDVREYSYFKEGDTTHNLKENETFTTFILKISLPTIMTVFFFSIGFNGVLWQAYGTIVEGMGTAAETFVDAELSKYVERALHTGSSYDFAFSASGTERGKKCQKIASELYRVARKNTSDLTTESQVAIGASIDKWVTKNFYKEDRDNWVSKLGFNENDDADFDNMVINVVTNSSKESLSDDSGTAIDVCDPASDVLGVGISSNDNAYVHVIVRREVKASSPNYFTVKEKKKGLGKVSGTNNSKPIQDNLDD